MGEEIFNLKICEILVNCGFKGNYIDLNFTDSGNILKNVTFPNAKVINPETELKKLRGKWIHEKLLYNIIESLFSDYTVRYHYRAPCLEGLELDIYIENLNVGIEYQGIQHYEAIKHWGGANGLKQRQINDMKKRNLCATHGVTLIYFDYTESITNTYVKNKMYSIIKER